MWSALCSVRSHAVVIVKDCANAIRGPSGEVLVTEAVKA